MVTVYEVRDPNLGFLRFASILRDEALGFATRFYNATDVICDIFEYERASKDFRSR